MDINKSLWFYLNNPLLFLLNKNLSFYLLGQVSIWPFKIVFIYLFITSIVYKIHIFLFKDPKMVIPTFITLFLICLSFKIHLGFYLIKIGFDVSIWNQKVSFHPKFQQLFLLFIFFHISKFRKFWDMTCNPPNYHTKWTKVSYSSTFQAS